MDAIEREICGALDTVCNELRGEVRSKPWTRRVYEHLTRIGQARGFQVSAAVTGADSGGWLYDVCWGLFPDTGPERVTLVVECEWSISTDDISWDFDKLLVARAEHRLMIFEQPRVEQVREIAAVLEQRARSFQQSQTGDRYLLAGFDFDDLKFQHYAFQV